MATLTASRSQSASSTRPLSAPVRCQACPSPILAFFLSVRVPAVATNTLRKMERREDAEAYFSAVCDAGVASAVHYGEPPRLPFCDAALVTRQAGHRCHAGRMRRPSVRSALDGPHGEAPGGARRAHVSSSGGGSPHPAMTAARWLLQVDDPSQDSHEAQGLRRSGDVSE